MPSSTSSSKAAAAQTRTGDEYWVKPMPERVAPPAQWLPIMLIAVAVIVAGVCAWELAMREQGLTTADLGDSKSAWARERRKVNEISHPVVIAGSSRLHFDIDLLAWRELTGKQPLQLARRGMTPRPMIADLARDERFVGLLVVGFDPLVFYGPAPPAQEFVDWVHEEPLFKRSGLVLYQQLSRGFAFLDSQMKPMEFMTRLSVPQRTARGAFNTPWKMSVSTADRQTYLWPRVESDAQYRARAEAIWMRARAAPPAPAEISAMIGAVAQDIRRIRDRGGEVVFVRAPSDSPLLEREEGMFPRSATWEPLLAATSSIGIHYADEPSLRKFRTVELSHLSRADSTPFTRELVALLEQALGAKGVVYGLGDMPRSRSP